VEKVNPRAIELAPNAMTMALDISTERFPLRRRNMLKLKSVNIMKILLVFAAVLSGCATSHQSANKAQPFSERLSQTTDKNLSVTSSQIKLFIFPLIDDKLAKAYTGISPKKSGMLPTFIKVDNMSQ
jgi:hypothetical protein